jgi:hypothetical protein
MLNNSSGETAATPATNNINLLVETVILNCMALQGEQGILAAYSHKTAWGVRS